MSITADQGIVFGVLFAALVLFVWGRWRYDLVALAALLVVAMAGLVEPGDAFAGFGHPAVVTVAAVLVVSRALRNAGVVDAIARSLTRVGDRPTVQVATLTALVAVCSGFMNNVGALALLMPVAIWMARKSGRSPSMMLMPLAFGSLLGGMTTLIGTPPNIIIASFRTQAGAPPFGMFDFLPVGGGVCLAGVAFIALVGWRMMPERQGQAAPEELFHVEDYITEVRVPEKSKLAGQTLHFLESQLDDEVEIIVVVLIRDDRRRLIPSPFEILRPGDILLVEAGSDDLKTLLEAGELELAEGEKDDRGALTSDDVRVIEAVIAPGSSLPGKTAVGLDLRRRYGVNLLAVARQGQSLRQRLGKVRFVVGDILLLQGKDQALQEALSALGCLPLAERGLRFGQPKRIALAAGLFLTAVVATSLGWLPVQIALLAAAVAMVLVGLVTLNDAYENIDWPVIVLLAAMIPVGAALETTGGAQLVADGLLVLGNGLPAFGAILLLLAVAMLLSNVVNNAAAAVLMAPIAIHMAGGLDASADPFLMAIAVGASSAFLTPIGHQSNTLVMAPGGYRFGDYWKMGLPMSLLVAAVAVPLILWAWPL